MPKKRQSLDEFLENYITPCGEVKPTPFERNRHLRSCEVCQNAGPASLCGRTFLNEHVLIDHYAMGCEDCEDLHAPHCQNPNFH